MRSWWCVIRSILCVDAVGNLIRLMRVRTLTPEHDGFLVDNQQPSFWTCWVDTQRSFIGSRRAKLPLHPPFTMDEDSGQYNILLSDLAYLHGV